MVHMASPEEKAELFKIATSNWQAFPNGVAVELSLPFSSLAEYGLSCKVDRIETVFEPSN